MFKPPKKLVLEIDKDEKKPARFPELMRWQWPLGKFHLTRIISEEASLTTGDYAIRGYHTVTLVERKGSFRELLDCFHRQSQKRFLGQHGQIARLLEVQRPWLLIDIPPAAMYDTRVMRAPECLIDDVLQLQLRNPKLGVHWFSGGTGKDGRLLVGEFILRLLWSAVLEKETNDAKG